MRIVVVSVLLLAGTFGLFLWEVRQGAEVAEARTVAVNMLVMGELFYLFNCRSLTRSMFALGVFSNPWAILGSLSMIGLQLLFTYSTVMNQLFHSAPISVDAWLRIVVIGLSVYVIIGLEKRVRRSTAAYRLAS